MNCIKCKHFKIKFNNDIRNTSYCSKFNAFINTIEEKIEKNKLKCFEEGENDITKFTKKMARTYGEPSKKFFF